MHVFGDVSIVTWNWCAVSGHLHCRPTFVSNLHTIHCLRYGPGGTHVNFPATMSMLPGAHFAIRSDEGASVVDCAPGLQRQVSLPS